MPQSVQDLHEVASDDEVEGHDESIPVFDPVDTDDTDSVIDALQRDLEGDAIPADTFIDSPGSSRSRARSHRIPSPQTVGLGARSPSLRVTPLTQGVLVIWSRPGTIPLWSTAVRLRFSRTSHSHPR